METKNAATPISNSSNISLTTTTTPVTTTITTPTTPTSSKSCPAETMDDRPSSSLSTSSRSACRIPRLNRSASMRMAKNKGASGAAGRSVPTTPDSPDVPFKFLGKGLGRSASFVSSRGMTLPSSSPLGATPTGGGGGGGGGGGRSMRSMTPETTRRFSHVTPPVSRKLTPPERKSFSPSPNRQKPSPPEKTNSRSRQPTQSNDPLWGAKYTTVTAWMNTEMTCKAEEVESSESSSCSKRRNSSSKSSGCPEERATTGNSAPEVSSSKSEVIRRHASRTRNELCSRFANVNFGKFESEMSYNITGRRPQSERRHSNSSIGKLEKFLRRALSNEDGRRPRRIRSSGSVESVEAQGTTFSTTTTTTTTTSGTVMSTTPAAVRKEMKVERNRDGNKNNSSHFLELENGIGNGSCIADDGDNDSVKSFGSVCSTMSCDTALARSNRLHHSYTHNHGGGGGGGGSGHNHWNGRNTKYVVHCNHNHGHDPDSYLTPTQRAARKIRELKSLLTDARREIAFKDNEIDRLTRELVELRLLKAQDPDKAGGRLTLHLKGEDGGEEEQEEEEGGRASASPSAGTPPPKAANTPSEGSEPELRRLMDPPKKNVSSRRRRTPPAVITAADTSTATTATSTTSSSASSTRNLSSPAVVSPATLESGADTTADSVDLPRSLADSGHYEDLTSPCASAKDPLENFRGSTQDRCLEEEEEEEDEVEEVEEVENPWEAVEVAEARLRDYYERKIDELKRNHVNEYHEMKEKHNDKVESLLGKLSDANLKYFEIRPLYDRAQEKLREAERELDNLRKELGEAEARHQKMYLQMYLKGQEAAKLEAADKLADAQAVAAAVNANNNNGPSSGVLDLVQRLATTEDELEKMKALYRRELARRTVTSKTDLDPEVTLQFLKSAVYYFLTDKDNSKGHLRAIESILGYSDMEKHNIYKVAKV